MLPLLIADNGVVTADQFVEWVLISDNMNPNTNHSTWKKHKEKIKSKFVESMGADMVDATKLKYSD